MADKTDTQAPEDLQPDEAAAAGSAPTEEETKLAGSEDEDEDEDGDDNEDEGPSAVSTPSPQTRGAPLPPPRGQGSRSLGLVLLALVLGGAVGFVGNDFTRKQKLKQATGACDELSEKLCSELGSETPLCSEVKSAIKLLTPAACLPGLEDVAGTVAKARGSRSVCDDLIKRLCAEIGPSTETCQMIGQQTKSFPTAQCELMNQQFDQVLGQVRMLAAQQARMGGLPMGGSVAPDAPPTPAPSIP